MPKYRVRMTRMRKEVAYAYVRASCPDEIIVEEGQVEFAKWVPDWDTNDFETTDIEEDNS